ncbi:MAG: hypothetical protein ACTSVI_01255 [Promethearchaeota archaeon]
MEVIHIMSTLEKKDAEESISLKEILVQCPSCKKSKKIEIPEKVILENSGICTIAVPAGHVCNHSFQVFIDKKFKARGYQPIDYELKTFEIYDKNIEKTAESNKKLDKFKDQALFEETIKVLRSYIDEYDVLGTALFSSKGELYYSSLPLETLYNTIREFETRDKKNLMMVKKYFLILQNNQKIFSEFFNFKDRSLIVTLILSENVKLGMGDLYLRKIIKDLQAL